MTMASFPGIARRVRYTAIAQENSQFRREVKTHAVDSLAGTTTATRPHSEQAREAYIMGLIDRASKEYGYTPSESLRTRFITQTTRAAFPRSADEVLTDFRRAVDREKRAQMETKPAKREVTKQRRSRRRKEELRRKTTRQNVGVTAGRQPRRGNMRLTRPAEIEPALDNAA